MKILEILKEGFKEILEAIKMYWKQGVISFSVMVGIVLLLYFMFPPTSTIEPQTEPYNYENEINELRDYIGVLNAQIGELQAQNGMLEEQLIVSKVEQLNLIEPMKELDKKQYYLSYKDIMSNVEDSPETIYDCFTEEDLNILFNIVEIEAEAGGFLEKANVASVIFNRINTNHLGAETLEEVLLEGGFSSVWSTKYNNIEISEDTILACEYAFEIEDTTCGCMYFESCDYMAFSDFAEYMFTDDIGHKFYKE